MNQLNSIKILLLIRKKFFVFFVFLMPALSCLSQQTDSISPVYHFSGTVNVTNNGVSLVPNFSLGKPAVIVNLSAGKNRFTVEPDIRFSLSGKPWTMLFWGRYKILPEGRFRLRTGAHLGLNYQVKEELIDGSLRERNTVRRYLAAELVPTYLITGNISLGMYYLYSHGLDYDTVGNTHFLIFNTQFSNIRISNQIFARLRPEIYYLKQDSRQGYFFDGFIGIEKANFPLSVSGLINQKLSGNIQGGKSFIWSLSLIYSFNQKFIPAP